MSKNIISKAMQSPFVIYHDAEHLAVSVASRLAALIRTAVARRGVCHIAFPGGRSSRRTLEWLSEQDLPWVALHFYPSDERCVPVGDAERNDQLIDELLLTRVPLPPENLHRIPAELGPEEGAARYRQLLAYTPPFDIALLGMGSDGHIASLFPQHPALADERAAIPVCNAIKPPSTRVSIGLMRLQAASERWIIVTGIEKQAALARVQWREVLPVTLVRPTGFFVDEAAAALLTLPFEDRQ